MIVIIRQLGKEILERLYPEAQKIFREELFSEKSHEGAMAGGWWGGSSI